MTQKRLLADMTFKEIETLYHNNAWLHGEIACFMETLQENQTNEIIWYLSKNKHVNYELGGYCDTIEADAGHIAEYIKTAEELHADGIINLYSCSSASFWTCAYDLAAKCDEYEREGLTTDPNDEFFELEYLNTKEELQEYLSAIETAIIEQCHDSIDYTYALELWIDDSAEKYASDGRYIFEIACRMYA